MIGICICSVVTSACRAKSASARCATRCRRRALLHVYMRVSCACSVQAQAYPQARCCAWCSGWFSWLMCVQLAGMAACNFPEGVPGGLGTCCLFQKRVEDAQVAFVTFIMLHTPLNEGVTTSTKSQREAPWCPGSTLWWFKPQAVKRESDEACPNFVHTTCQ